MLNLTKATALAALLIPGIAFAQMNEGDRAGTTEAEIIAFLTAQGYEITETEIEDDEFEAYAMMDGQTYEIEVSLETGMVTEIELED